MGVVVVAAVIEFVCCVALLEGFGDMAVLQVFDVSQFANAGVGVDHRVLYHAYAFLGLNCLNWV